MKEIIETSPSIKVRKLTENDPRRAEWEMLMRVGERALQSTLDDLRIFSGEILDADKSKEDLLPTHARLESNFLTNLVASNYLARRTLRDGGRPNARRAMERNEEMAQRLAAVKELTHQGMDLWVLDGIEVLQQGGGLKKIAYANNGHYGSDLVHDLSVSAATGRLGFGNPWQLDAKLVESLLQTSGQPMFHYHPSEVQAFAMEELVNLHPNKEQVANREIRVYQRGSGSEVNSVAIEIVWSHAANKFFQFDENGYPQNPKIRQLLEDYGFANARGVELQRRLKQLELAGLITAPKVFGVDGTWIGGHSGAATQATGWGVDSHTNMHTGGESWVRRNLPLFTAENHDRILEILSQAVEDGECAGLVIEPDFAGDAGLVPVDPNVLTDVRKLLEAHDLPIIADCVQTVGSVDGHYFGDGTRKVLGNYKNLVVTTAKAAAVDPIGLMLIPRHIDQSTTPGSHYSTPTYGGPLLQAVVTARMVEDPELQEKIIRDSQDFEIIAATHGFQDILRGKGMNRGWYVGEENIKLAQLFFYVEYGILFGRLGGVLRDQRSMTEFSSTHQAITEIICQGLERFFKGDISQEVLDIYEDSKNRPAGGL